MATKNKGKAGVVAQAQALMAGANKHLSNMTQVMLVGQSLTPAQIVEKLQSLVDLRTAVDTAKATTKAKLVAERANAPAIRTFMGALTGYVKSAYLDSPDVLADFGIQPKTRSTPTVATKSASIAKAAATRAARHTMGSKQRLAVTGNVSGVTVTPIVDAPPVASPHTT